jgi:hypothetical protein
MVKKIPFVHSTVRFQVASKMESTSVSNATHAIINMRHATNMKHTKNPLTQTATNVKIVEKCTRVMLNWNSIDWIYIRNCIIVINASTRPIMVQILIDIRRCTRESNSMVVVFVRRNFHKKLRLWCTKEHTQVFLKVGHSKTWNNYVNFQF